MCDLGKGCRNDCIEVDNARNEVCFIAARVKHVLLDRMEAGKAL